MEPAAETPRSPRRRGRGAAFRLAAVLLGLAPFVLAEAACVVFDWGRPDLHDDPFVGFSGTRRLFVLSDDGSRCEIPPSRQSFFRPESFDAVKAPGEYRIFCLGGSTVQGRPFAVETSFTTWLELDLAQADPGRKWQVVNCGGVSYASYRLVPVLREVFEYEPDLIVLYTGHNEFLEDREYGHIRDIPAVVRRPLELAAGTRTFNLLREAALRLADSAGSRPVLGDEVDAMLDYKGGLAKYHRDETWQRGVIEHFRSSLARIVQLCRAAGVRLLLVNPASNLRACPPFKSQHRDGLSADELRRWNDLCRAAGEQLGLNPFRAAALLAEARAIDDRHAGLHFLLGECLEAAGRHDAAREAYVRAKELDVCPLRMLEPMHEALLETARRTGTPLVDARALIERRSEGFAGGYLMLDHVHPSITGHRLIAEALTDELIRRGIVRPRVGWEARRDVAARKHLRSLGRFYFAKGRERLRALRGWAAGRSSFVPPRGDGQAP